MADTYDKRAVGWNPFNLQPLQQEAIRLALSSAGSMWDRRQKHHEQVGEESFPAKKKNNTRINGKKAPINDFSHFYIYYFAQRKKMLYEYLKKKMLCRDSSPMNDLALVSKVKCKISGDFEKKQEYSVVTFLIGALFCSPSLYRACQWAPQTGKSWKPSDFYCAASVHFYDHLWLVY